MGGVGAGVRGGWEGGGSRMERGNAAAGGSGGSGGDSGRVGGSGGGSGGGGPWWLRRWQRCRCGPALGSAGVGVLGGVGGQASRWR